MFEGAEVGVARDAMRRLMLTPVFDELTKRSLLARIIKLYPELESIITGEQKEEKSEALVIVVVAVDLPDRDPERIIDAGGASGQHVDKGLRMRARRAGRRAGLPRHRQHDREARLLRRGFSSSESGKVASR